MNKVNLASGVGNRKYRLQLGGDPIKKTMLMDPFMSQDLTWSLFFFLSSSFHCYAWYFFLTRESMCVQTHDKPMFSPCVKIFFLLKPASLSTSHILLSISHGLHFSATKTLMTDFCSSLEQFDLICCYFE